MKESDEKLTESELRKKTLVMVMRLKNSRHDREVIYARLEKE